MKWQGTGTAMKYVESENVHYYPVPADTFLWLADQVDLVPQGHLLECPTVEFQEETAQ
ncbi:MAG: hypothetical protein LBB83_01480 [Treponema sp.]|jgi:hypothetical protein|nr:hypothetical protein [Treponema sp.]